MKANVKKKWVKALKSGKYKQAKSELRGELDDGTIGHCCLGVLTDLYCKEKKKGFGLVCDGQDAFLPERVMGWAGLESNDPRIETHHKSLAVINDSGSSFETIANLIDKNL